MSSTVLRRLNSGSHPQFFREHVSSMLFGHESAIFCRASGLYVHMKFGRRRLTVSAETKHRFQVLREQTADTDEHDTEQRFPHSHLLLMMPLDFLVQHRGRAISAFSPTSIGFMHPQQARDIEQPLPAVLDCRKIRTPTRIP